MGLPTKLQILSGITDGGNELNFSLNEQKVGKWIDGRVVYQRTIEYTLPSSGGTHGLDYIIIEDIDEIILADGLVIGTQSGHTRFLPVNYTRTDGYNTIGMSFIVEGNYFTPYIFTNNSDTYGKKLYLTILYTKK